MWMSVALAPPLAILLAAAAPDTATIGEPLTLPRPKVLPCQRFETVELEVGKDVDSLAGDDAATVTWRAGGRDWSFTGHLWSQPPAPLAAAALPARAQVAAGKPVGAARLTFHCKLYPPTDEGQAAHDADPFLGVRWLCTSAGCVPEAGHALPRPLATSGRRLRLCAAEPAGDAGAAEAPSLRPCRDIGPARAERDKALALAGEVLADARRTVEDACRRPGVCGPRAREVLAQLRPRRWQATAFGEGPVGVRLDASADERRLELDCPGPRGGARCSLTLRDRDGQRLLTYTPIAVPETPAEALLWIDGRPIVVLTAAPNERDAPDPPGCSVAGPLLLAK